MTIPLIIYRSLRQHALSTLVTIINIALACGLLMAVWTIHAQSPGNIPGGTTSVSSAPSAILTMVAVVVMLIATGIVFASAYASMGARQRDIAILRALGAKRSTIFRTVILEAAVIGAIGALCGFAVHAVLMIAVGATLLVQTGAETLAFAWNPIFLWTPPGMTALAALAGLMPAMKAYRVPVAQTLSPLS